MVVEHRAVAPIAARLLEPVKDSAAQRLLRVERGVNYAATATPLASCVPPTRDRIPSAGRIGGVRTDSRPAANVRISRPVDDDQALVDEVAQMLRAEGADLLPPR